MDRRAATYNYSDVMSYLLCREGFNGCYVILGAIWNPWCNLIAFLVFTESLQQWPDLFFGRPHSLACETRRKKPSQMMKICLQGKKMYVSPRSTCDHKVSRMIPMWAWQGKIQKVPLYATSTTLLIICFPVVCYTIVRPEFWPCSYASHTDPFLTNIGEGLVNTPVHAYSWEC